MSFTADRITTTLWRDETPAPMGELGLADGNLSSSMLWLQRSGLVTLSMSVINFKKLRELVAIFTAHWSMA